MHAAVLCVSAWSQAASRKGFMVTYLPAECLKTVPGVRVLLKWSCSKVNPIHTLARERGFLETGEVPVMVIITLDIRVWLDGVGSISYTFPLWGSHDDFGRSVNGGRLSRHGETEIQGGAKAAMWRSGAG